MIPCPSCGTPNRKGSKYCSGCGQPLEPTTDVECPCCERMNPGGARFCAFCGASLTGAAVDAAAPPREELQPPGAPVEAARADTPAASGSAEAELPAWLYASSPPSETPSPAEGEPPERQLGKDELNKYLDGIVGLLPGTDVWLTRAQRSGTAGPTAG